MKKIIFLLLLLFQIAFAFAQSDSLDLPHGQLVIYRGNATSRAEIEISINSIKAYALEPNSVVIHNIYSEGEYLIKPICINLPGGISRQISVKLNNGDTLYYKLTFGFGEPMEFEPLTKADMAEILTKKRPSVFTTRENLAFPYNPISSKHKGKLIGERNGTGFLISDQGYIITNFHVIDGTKEISISGINGNKKSSFSASVVVQDETNDLAILKLDDDVRLGQVPFSIKKDPSDVGENVFVLGYPLINSMGKDIKLTNGLISSKSGFEGNINSYQISAPVQHGNSGGPLFDMNGHLIGIVNAKHSEAENASYAIKVKYLLELIDAMDKKFSLPPETTLTGKSLADQVKELEKFTYIITAK